MKILVISLAGIGDTLLATPLLRELRANFPDATIDALVLWAGARDLLENNPHLSTLHQRNLLRESRLSSVRFLLSLRSADYDVSLNTHPQSRVHYRLAAWLAGACSRLSHRYECSGQMDRWLVTRELPQDYRRHTIEHNFDFLPLLGAQRRTAEDRMELRLERAELDWAAEFAAAKRRPGFKLLGIHPGSGGTKNLTLKRWPLGRYLELLRRVSTERTDIQVLLFGGPDEETDHEQIIAAIGSKRVSRAPTRNLRQAGALMQHCDAFLSVDTALMHLAAAVRAPRQMVIEAPTLNATNLPWGNPYTLVPNPAVAGRSLDFYRYDGEGIKGSREELIRVMESVTADAVFAKLNETLPR